MEENIKPHFVLDASFVMSYLMPDEKSSQGESFFSRYKQQEIVLISPTLLRYELSNSLRSSILRKRITDIQAQKLLTSFEYYKIREHSVDLKTILSISLKHNISCYDAAYVALAHEKNAKLLTFDVRLKRLAE